MLWLAQYDCPYGMQCTLLSHPQHLLEARHAAHPTTYLPYNYAPYPPQVPYPQLLYTRYAPHPPLNPQPATPESQGLLQTDPWCEHGAGCALQNDEDHRQYFWHPCKEGKDCTKLNDALHTGQFYHFNTPFEDLVRTRHCLHGQGKTIDLLTTSCEHQWVTTLINNKGGLNGQRIDSIVRVNNGDMFEMFLSHVLSLQVNTASIKTLDNTHAHIKWLFHTPTAPAHVELVASHGLQFQFGAPLGDGIYFTTATNSPLFIPVNGTGSAAQCKHFVLSVVLVGTSVVGSAGRRLPPSGCHSTVDNQANPSTYVSFSKEHAYPAYIIKLK